MKTLETLEKGGKNPGKFQYGYTLSAYFVENSLIALLFLIAF
jgi:hypothetical protein